MYCCLILGFCSIVHFYSLNCTDAKDTFCVEIDHGMYERTDGNPYVFKHSTAEYMLYYSLVSSIWRLINPDYSIDFLNFVEAACESN